MKENLYITALLWMVGRITREEYVSFLEELYMRPENKSNDLLLRLEEANGTIKDTNHVFSQSIQYGPEKWEEEAIIKKIVETLIRHYEKTNSILDTLELGYDLRREATLSCKATIREPLILICQAFDYLQEDYFYPEGGCRYFMKLLHFYSSEASSAEINKAIEIVRKERRDRQKRKN
ncbi:MAG: hypothetical protein J5653_10915 [Clostridiales bacterium]|nr:hypothetical protein [Clostridiales bacterium]